MTSNVSIVDHFSRPDINAADRKQPWKAVMAQLEVSGGKNGPDFITKEEAPVADVDSAGQPPFAA